MCKVNVDPDVQAEADKINLRLPTQHTNDKILLRNLSKKYDKHLAVNQLSVGVEAAECFGLVGTNGAGKTSVFKMLTGEENITGGDALIGNNINEPYKKVGYCPQFDAVMDDLTGRETLKIFSMLRGIPRDNIDFITSNLADELRFDKHLDKQIKALSGGNKRKLSTALALLGGSSVLLLDGPTTGMDPGAKRCFWNIVNKARDSGHSVILSSHCMGDIEALCTKLTIMVNGEFKCLGSTKHLKNRFARGFVLTITISNLQQIQSVKDNIAMKFPNSVLKEQYSNHFIYHITDTYLKLSQIFGKIDKLKNEIEIADYSITETTLEQVFLQLSKNEFNQ